MYEIYPGMFTLWLRRADPWRGTAAGCGTFRKSIPGIMSAGEGGGLCGCEVTWSPLQAKCFKPGRSCFGDDLL